MCKPSLLAQGRVAPLVGAWIEIYTFSPHSTSRIVAPLVGAWIEILVALLEVLDDNVAPLVGAWIEILKDS